MLSSEAIAKRFIRARQTRVDEVLETLTALGPYGRGVGGEAPTTGPIVHVVVPTSQIFLDEFGRFDTRKFNFWRQKTIYEYTRAG